MAADLDRASAGQVAAGTQRKGSGAATRLQGLLALRAFLLAPHPPASGGAPWTAAVLAALVPAAAAHLHGLLSASPPLPPEDVQVRQAHSAGQLRSKGPNIVV